MEFQDRILRCADCGTEFVWTAGEQQFFADKNFKNEPKRCKGCKAKRTSRPPGSPVAPRERVRPPWALLVQDRVRLIEEVVDGGRDRHPTKCHVLVRRRQQRRQRGITRGVLDVFDESA